LGDFTSDGAGQSAAYTWTFAERLAHWAQRLPDRDTRAILLNLGGVMIGLAGTVVTSQEGGGAPALVASMWTIFYLCAVASSIIDKVQS
jgi:hypothetical protein